MIHRVDATLRNEARQYKLAFTCEACAGFDPERLECSLGYPIEPHHRIDLETAEQVIFCKAFELT
jgi:hypothetical protein